MKSFGKKVAKKNLYKEYVQILNGELQLSFREAEVFSILLELNDKWSDVVVNTNNILTTDIRRKVMNDTRITKTNLIKYIRSLKNKGIIVRDESGGWKINDLFVPEFTDGINEIVFILDVE